jgi:sugar lactone lactonase YvrE
MDLKPKRLVDGLLFPEGPRWHDGRLWISDMEAHKVIAVDSQGRAEVIVELDDRPSGLGWLPDGSLLISSMVDRKLLRLDLGGLSVFADLTEYAGRGLNDMVVDGQGRAYVDALDSPASSSEIPGRIVLVMPDGSSRLATDDVTSPNGSGITADGKTFIVCESLNSGLRAFDITADGTLVNGRSYAKVDNKMVDGMCLDAEGAVWVGAIRAGEFLRVLEGGEVTDRIAYDGKTIACMLGGDDRRTLFLLNATASPGEIRAAVAAGREPPELKAWVDTVQVDVPGEDGLRSRRSDNRSTRVPYQHPPYSTPRKIESM